MKPIMKTFAVVIIIVSLIIMLYKGSVANVDWVKNRAVAKWQKQGFSVVDYDGYQMGTFLFGSSYGGAHVWHRLKKIPDNGITYSGCLMRWGDELHVYGPFAADAIKP